MRGQDSWVLFPVLPLLAVGSVDKSCLTSLQHSLFSAIWVYFLCSLKKLVLTFTLLVPVCEITHAIKASACLSPRTPDPRTWQTKTPGQLVASAHGLSQVWGSQGAGWKLQCQGHTVRRKSP